jgi:hypothetical protein
MASLASSDPPTTYYGGNMKDRTVGISKGADDFEEILDEDQQDIMGGTGQELVLWPWDLE